MEERDLGIRQEEIRTFYDLPIHRKGRICNEGTEQGVREIDSEEDELESEVRGDREVKRLRSKR